MKIHLLAQIVVTVATVNFYSKLKSELTNGVNVEQQAFMERLATLIPRLFEAIRLGNVKSEYILGLRQIGGRQVQLRLVAEVIDPGQSPLSTHSEQRSSNSLSVTARQGETSQRASARRRPRKR